MRHFRHNRESHTSVELLPRSVPRARNAGAPEPRSFASADWLAWPTLASRGGDIKTAGVYYHQDAFRRVLGLHGALVMTELRIEPAGEYAGAVRVFAGGELIGNIPHGQAEAIPRGGRDTQCGRNARDVPRTTRTRPRVFRRVAQCAAGAAPGRWTIPPTYTILPRRPRRGRGRTTRRVASQ